MRHSCIAIIVALALAAPPALAAADDVGEVVIAGRAAVAAGDDTQAVALFERAIALDPSRSDTYYSLGLLYRKRERWRDAIEAFRHAVASASAPAEAHCQLGELLTEALARPEEALRHLRTATRVDPRYARSYLLLGVALLRTGDVIGAQAALRDAGRIDALNPDIAFQLGTVAMRLGSLDEARTAFEGAIALDELHAKSYLALGACLMRLGRTAEGRAALARFRRLSVQEEQIARLETLTALDPSQPERWAELGKVRLARGEWSRAVTSFETAVELCRVDAAGDVAGRTTYRERLGYSYFRLARYSEAATAFAAVVQAAPRVAAYRNSLAGALLMSGEPARAVEVYLAAVELAPDDARLRMNLAKAYDQADRPAEAAQARAARARIAGHAP